MSYTIHDFLRDYPVTVTPLPARTDSATENFDNSCGHFQVTLTYEDGKPMTIPFSVGSGILLNWARDKIEAGEIDPRKMFPSEASRAGVGDLFARDVQKALNPVGPRTMLHVKMREALLTLARERYTPDAADVLNCLAMDYSTFTNSRDFEDWANDFGFDTDSRKAERMYHAVREQCSAFELLLGRELAEKLAFDVEPL